MKPSVITEGNGRGSAPGSGDSHDSNVHGGTSTGGRQFSHPHFQQNFGFDPDIESMFPESGLRSRLSSRMQDPFGTFGARKRCNGGINEPMNDGSASYFDDDADFFPQFGTLGSRRRAGTGGMPTMDANGADNGDDFFVRLPPEFRQYIPEGFGTNRRRSGSTGPQSPRVHQQQPQQYAPQYYPKEFAYTDPYNRSVSPKSFCDAAIQTENSQQNQAVGGDTVDSSNLKQHGFRNTVDLGVKSTPEDLHGVRAHSAPPNEPGTRNISQSNSQHNTSSNHATQTNAGSGNAEPNIQRSYQSAQNQSQQPQFSPSYNNQQPSATPGGGYVRTIPIFVEGRSEPIINSHKEIPNQSQSSAGGGKTSSTQQQRPTPLNTQQQTSMNSDQASQQGAPPPQTPHTMESINKIQDIQRDVLALMSKVEKFSGTRQDKEYAYLDEMLTRNLLKLDTIDTNGKESIRMARKEAIKCIQASINVLEAKAEENAKTTSAQQSQNNNDDPLKISNTTSTEKTASNENNHNEAIPLPPPENLKNETSNQSKEDVSASAAAAIDAKTE